MIALSRIWRMRRGDFARRGCWRNKPNALRSALAIRYKDSDQTNSSQLSSLQSIDYSRNWAVFRKI